MSFISTRLKHHFHKKGRALNLVLIQRPEGTRKWPTLRFLSRYTIQALSTRDTVFHQTLSPAPPQKLHIKQLFQNIHGKTAYSLEHLPNKNKCKIWGLKKKSETVNFDKIINLGNAPAVEYIKVIFKTND